MSVRRFRRPRPIAARLAVAVRTAVESLEDDGGDIRDAVEATLPNIALVWLVPELRQPKATKFHLNYYQSVVPYLPLSPLHLFLHGIPLEPFGGPTSVDVTLQPFFLKQWNLDRDSKGRSRNIISHYAIQADRSVLFSNADWMARLG
jgi:hypothetical protein